ncbi:MAG TPA: DUF3467 domain-containing protein [Candidatus Krumholzibacteria bacterium]|nr:DUF3467 domain-containing protein [Candidatus Krumholzibacteria bacterium]HRX50685.1 DUF3467 domain-containing protein [Candidatus Krumholzibacteria bacterium]
MEKKTQQINVELPQEVAEGNYANLALIAHSPSEFILDFARMLPGLPKAKVCARMVMTPTNAKALLRTLQTNVQRYEESFGEIKMPGTAAETRFHFPDTKN